MESTEEIYRSYLARAGHGKSYTDFDNVYDYDQLEDPLDDTPELSMDSLAPSSPPTPLESPVYFHAELPDPTKTVLSEKKRPSNDLDLTFSMTDVENANQPLDYGLATLAKDQERYQKLSASATEKLMERLRLEQARNAALQRRLDALESERQESRLTRGDYELLLHENTALKGQVNTLTQQLREATDNGGAQLTRENQLLREKLLKYKTLYEELKRKNTVFPDPIQANPRPSNEAPIQSQPNPEISRDQAPEQEPRQASDGSMSMNEIFDMVKNIEQAQLKHKAHEDSFNDMRSRLSALLQALTEQKRSLSDLSSSEVAPESHPALGSNLKPEVLPGHHPISGGSQESASGVPSRSRPLSQPLAPNYSAQLDELVQLLQRITNEVEHFGKRRDILPPKTSGSAPPSSSCRSCTTAENEQRGFNAFSIDGEETKDLRGTWAWNNSI